jgi:diguanylate cyclase (GGDEF)-like protein
VLKSNLRKVDIIARYGGEEFVVVLPELGPTQALEVAEKLRMAIEQQVSMPGPQEPLPVTISIGVASSPLHAREQTAFVDAADAALYASKRGGRNRVTVFESGMENEASRRRGPHTQKSHSGIYVKPSS